MSVTIEAQNLCLFSRRYNTINGSNESNESSEASQATALFVFVLLGSGLEKPSGGE